MMITVLIGCRNRNVPVWQGKRDTHLWTGKPNNNAQTGKLGNSGTCLLNGHTNNRRFS